MNSSNIPRIQSALTLFTNVILICHSCSRIFELITFWKNLLVLLVMLAFVLHSDDETQTYTLLEVSSAFIFRPTSEK